MLYHSILELIGNTPLLELRKIATPHSNRIFAKLESYNPAGGIKDRIALYALKELEKEGKLNADSVIIEATAGNTGLGIALVARQLNCKATLVVPDKFSLEKQVLMKALGAEIINTPKDKGMEGAIEVANELLKSIPNAIKFNQFENPHNPQAHYHTSAREIYADMEGKIDYFVSGAGSGGSFSGIAKYLKERDASICAVLCDPIGSIIGGGNAGEAHIEGIGNCFIPRTMDTSLIDEVQKISDEEAYKGMRMLALSEGILGGISSGACLIAALKIAQKVRNKRIVMIVADSLSRYVSKGLI